MTSPVWSFLTIQPCRFCVDAQNWSWWHSLDQLGTRASPSGLGYLEGQNKIGLVDMSTNHWGIGGSFFGCTVVEALLDVQIQQTEEHEIESLNFSPDNARLAAAGGLQVEICREKTFGWTFHYKGS